MRQHSARAYIAESMPVAPTGQAISACAAGARESEKSEKRGPFLPNDVSRCDGVGPRGQACVSRDVCVRYLALGQGDRAVVSPGMCFDGCNSFIPLPAGFVRALAAIHGPDRPLTRAERNEFKQSLCRVKAQDELKRAPAPQLGLGE